MGTQHLNTVHPNAALTPMEQKVLNAVCATGAADIVLSKHFGITNNTLRRHFLHIFAKMHFHNKSELIVFCWRKRYKKLEDDFNTLKGKYDELSKSTDSTEANSTTQPSEDNSSAQP